MDKDDARKVEGRTGKEQAAAIRAERLGKQLRENLHRRKQQSRVRKTKLDDKQE
jgi:hypothetical protein